MAEKQQQQQQQYKPYALSCFEKYTNFQLINETELDIVINYICGHLNQDYLNQDYLECICNEKVVDFLKNPDKKCNCNHGCASVYFDKVF